MSEQNVHAGSGQKKFGIRITLTAENPMRASHLLGEDWESFRWYDTPEARDEAYEDITRHMPNYRQGDHQAQIATKVDR